MRPRRDLDNRARWIPVTDIRLDLIGVVTLGAEYGDRVFGCGASPAAGLKPVFDRAVGDADDFFDRLFEFAAYLALDEGTRFRTRSNNVREQRR